MITPRELVETSRRWSVAEAPAAWVLGVSALVGALIALRTFGLHYILGDSAFWSWPVGDAAMMLTGWNYFVHEPWQWPLGQTYATNGAAGINILYLDTIPLVAVVGKLVHSVLGGTFHPYGLWHLALYVLQAVLATLLARALGIKSLLGGVAMAVLALSMHAFVLRFYHEGLNGHFVLLWALLVYLRSAPQRRAAALAAEWTACLACAVLLHPYLGAMTVAVAVAAFVRLASADPRRAALVSGAVAAALVLVLLVFGYVPQALPPSPGLFGLASMNLLSLAVPLHSTLVPALPAAFVQDTTGVQWDGSNFLGVGVWALLIAALLGAPRAVTDQIRRHRWLALVLALLALFAPSNRAWLGSRLLWHYEVPASLMTALDNLPATGRFFWPVGYALLVASCAVVHRRFGHRGTVALAVASLVQLVDSTAAARIVTTNVAAPWKRELDWEAWQHELSGEKKVNIYPSFWCWPGPPPFPDQEIQAGREVELMVSANGAHTNAGRAGRHITDCAKELAERTKAAEGALRDGEVYLFWKPAYSAELLTTLGPDRCTDRGHAFVCRSRSGAAR